MKPTGIKATGFAALLKNIRMYFRLFIHRDTPWYVKAILLAALFYLILPADVIPDWLLGVGILDDLTLVSLMVGLALKLLGRNSNDSGETGSDDQS
jgi:uncharacterized membrane protein YkvA (DUF1232 family)